MPTCGVMLPLLVLRRKYEADCLVRGRFVDILSGDIERGLEGRSSGVLSRVFCV